jgi:cobalt/nickel transport system permease protein
MLHINFTNHGDHAKISDRDRLNPWEQLAVHTRLLWIFLMVFAIALTPNGHWLTWLIYGIAALPILYWSQVNLKLLTQRMAIELAFGSVALLGTLFRQGGEVLWQWHWLQISTHGLMILGSVSIKAFLSLLFLNILTLSTSIPLLLQALVTLKIPPLLVSIMAAMCRYIDVLSQEFQSMRIAAQSRNFAPQNLYAPQRRDRHWQRQVLGNMLGMLFIRTYNRGDRIHQAMIARGYQGTPVLTKSVAGGWRDRLALGCAIFIILLGQIMYKDFFIGFVVMTTILIVGGRNLTAWLAGISPISILIIFIFAYLDIYIHEFGHAIAGWLVGFPIKRITIGMGRKVFKYKIKATNTDLVINSGFQGGMTQIGTISRQFLKPRFFVFVLGGVFLQSLVTAIAILVTEHNLLGRNVDFNQIIYLFIYSNFLLIILNIIPYNIQMMGVPMPNDGLLLCKIFWMKPTEIMEILMAGKLFEGLEKLEEKEFQQAANIFRECVHESPQLAIPKINLSVALIKQQQFVEAIAILEQALELLENDPRKIIALNNLAWSYLHLSIKDNASPSQLSQAREYADTANNINKNHPTIIGTRSCILIEQGELAAGTKLLKGIIKINQSVDEMTNSAIGFLYLAYAYYLQADFATSKKYWQKIQTNKELMRGDYPPLFDHVLSKTNHFAKHATV